ncbi:MAG: calcium-binding protein, partial [Paracoccaceae bacterium]
MPATLVTNTTRFVAFETEINGVTHRIEISGLYLVVDPATGQITSGTVSKISNFSYSGALATAEGTAWSNFSLTVAALNALIAGDQWQTPQEIGSSFLDMMALLPPTTQSLAFSPTSTVAHGTVFADYLFGGAKSDAIYGGAGNDRVYGGDGIDLVTGGLNDDRVYGGNGDDTVYGEEGNDKLYGGSGYNTIFGGEGNDAL